MSEHFECGECSLAEPDGCLKADWCQHRDGITSVERIGPVGKGVQPTGKPRPPCVAEVLVGTGTREAARRAYRQARVGLPLNQCSLPSYWMIGGQPMCTHHAGHWALIRMIEMTAK